MYFTGIRLSGLASETFPVLNVVHTDPYIVKNITGLGPPDMDVIIANALKQGGIHQSSLPQTREIIIRIGLNPNYMSGGTAGDLRSDLYWMMEHELSDGILIEILEGTNVIAETRGFVSRFETVPFTKTPEVQITFRCESPYLTAPNFIFDSSTNHELILTPEGNARMPVIVEARMLGTTTQFGIRRLIMPGEAEIESTLILGGFTFQNNDIVRVDSTPGNRRITVTRGSTVTNLIGYTTNASRWPMLDPKVSNAIRVSGNTYPLARIQSFQYKPHYWGV